MTTLLHQPQQILPIPILGQRRGQLLNLGGVYPALPKGNFFGAAHLQALAFLEGADEAGGVQQAVMGAGV